jgi:hypothetical protein
MSPFPVISSYIWIWYLIVFLLSGSTSFYLSLSVPTKGYLQCIMEQFVAMFCSEDSL